MSRSVFVCYSKEDVQWLDRMKVHFEPEIRAGHLDLWSDSRINAGDAWREKIEEALEIATIAILLVSADFIASRFIHEVELPRLLGRTLARDSMGLLVLPILVKPTDLPEELARFQFVNLPERTLLSMSEVEREQLWVQLKRTVATRQGPVSALKRLIAQPRECESRISLALRCMTNFAMAPLPQPMDSVELDLEEVLPYTVDQVYFAMRDAQPQLQKYMKNIDSIELLYYRAAPPGAFSGYLWNMSFAEFPIVQLWLDWVPSKYAKMLLSAYEHGLWNDKQKRVYWNYENPFFRAHGVHHFEPTKSGCIFRMKGEVVVYVDRVVTGPEGVLFVALYGALKSHLKELVLANMKQLSRGVGEYLREKGHHHDQ